MSPFESAWLLLKDFYINHPNSRRGGFHQPARFGQSELIASLDSGTPKGTRGHYEKRFDRLKDPNRVKEGFSKVLRDGKTDYAGNVYDEDTDSMVGPHNRPQQSPEEFRLGSSVPRRQPVDESERQAGATPTGPFIGVGLDSSVDDSDESIQLIGDILGHEFTHALIEPEIEDFVTAKVSGDDELKNKLRSFAHEYGAHQSDQASQAGVNQRLAARADTRGMFEQMMASKFGFYPTIQMQGQALSMIPPPTQIQPEQPMQPEQQPTQ